MCVCLSVQCVAMCCSVLQCVAVCCSVLQCVAVCCSVLQCVAMCLSVCMSDCSMCAVQCVGEMASIVAQMRLILFTAMAVEGDAYVCGWVGGRVGVWVSGCMCVCVWVLNVCGALCPGNGTYSSAGVVYALRRYGCGR